MKLISICIIVATLASAATAQPNLDLKTTIDVNTAAPRDVFESISKRLGCKLVLAPEITQPVTMRIQNVTLRTALTALSEALECRWRIEGNVLRVELASSAGSAKGSIPGGSLIGWNADFRPRLERKTPANFHFDNVPLSTIASELGKIADMEIKVTTPYQGRQLTIDLSNSTIGEALRIAALKIRKEKSAPGNPVVFYLTVQGKVKEKG